MDTEEDIKIQKAIRSGKSETDEGPYYHGSWWESYKGGVKGKLGGVIIGAAIGTGMGIAAAGALAIAATGVTFAVASLVTAGFAAGGMMYGAHEFGEIGHVTGAVAAAHEKSEERMKSFENGKFAELKKELSDLKSLITGKKIESEAATTAATKPESSDYPTMHMEKPNGLAKPVFWKIAGIGLAVGLAVGALLAAGGVSEHLFSFLGTASGPLSKAGEYAASMTAMGLFGASFGINRDIFRTIFDRTDRLFKGLFSKGHAPAVTIEPAQPTVTAPEPTEATVTTVVFETYVDAPQSDTHHRDKVLAQARQALLSLDHTKAIPH